MLQIEIKDFWNLKGRDQSREIESHGRMREKFHFRRKECKQCTPSRAIARFAFKATVRCGGSCGTVARGRRAWLPTEQPTISRPDACCNSNLHLNHDLFDPRVSATWFRDVRAFLSQYISLDSYHGTW